MYMKKGVLLVIPFLFLLLVAIAAVLLIGGFSGKLSLLDSQKTSFTYTQQYDSDPLHIGDKEFKAIAPRYLCGYVGEKVLSKNTERSCWSSKIVYEGQEFNIYAGQSIRLNDYLIVHYDLKAQMYSDSSVSPYVYKDKQHWTSYYTFTLSNFEITSEVESTEYYYELNSEKDLLIKINNDLASFDKSHAGVWIRPKHDLLERGEIWTENNISIIKGTSYNLFVVDTDELGKVKYEYQPYVIIDADSRVVLKQNNPINIEYEIVLDIPEDHQNIKPSWFDVLIEMIKSVLRWFS